VLEVPAGQGGLSFALAAAGFPVTPADLFPEFLHDYQRRLNLRSARDLFREMSRVTTVPQWLAIAAFGPEGDAPVAGHLRCEPADLEGSIQAEDGSFDCVVCVEGIEHVADRHHTLREFRRVLRPGGRLLLTTPNLMSLRGRLAFALAGQRALKSYIDEHTSVWGQSPDGRRIYHGHAFLLTYFQIRYSLWHAGFRIRRLRPSNWSLTSLLLWPVGFPLVAAATWLSQRPARRRYARLEQGRQPPRPAESLEYRLPHDAASPYAEMFRHLLSPNLLLNSTMIIEAEARPPRAP
jgi:SAM-dependent methyltransferase